MENEHAVTASNLFKYCQPAHGLVLFRRHDPLAFTAPELRGALAAAAEWLRLVRAHGLTGPRVWVVPAPERRSAQADAAQLLRLVRAHGCLPALENPRAEHGNPTRS